MFRSRNIIELCPFEGKNTNYNNNYRISIAVVYEPILLEYTCSASIDCNLQFVNSFY